MASLVITTTPITSHTGNGINLIATKTTRKETGELVLVQNIHALDIGDNTYVIMNELLAPTLPNGKEVIHAATLQVNSWAELTTYIQELLDSESN